MGNNVGRIVLGRVVAPIMGAWVIREASINIAKESEKHEVMFTWFRACIFHIFAWSS